MAGPDLGVESVESNGITSILASEGIDFVLSGQGKVSPMNSEFFVYMLSDIFFYNFN